MSTTKNFLFAATAFVLLHSGYCWKYCDKWDNDRDKFNVRDCEVEPRSLNSVLFKLKGTPEVGIGRGGGDLVPTIELKLYESDSKKEIYSGTKDMCDFTDCSLKKDRKATIKVRVSDLDEKLERDVFYTGEMTVIEKCGTKITCVQDKFCIAKSEDGDVTDKNVEVTIDKNKKEKDVEVTIKKKNKNTKKNKKDKDIAVTIDEDPSSGGDPDPIIITDPIVFGGEGNKKMKKKD